MKAVNKLFLTVALVGAAALGGWLLSEPSVKARKTMATPVAARSSKPGISDRDSLLKNETKADVLLRDWAVLSIQQKQDRLETHKIHATDSDVVRLSLHALTDTNGEVRKAAVFSTRHIHTSEVEPVIRAALNDLNAEIRLQAIHETRYKPQALKLELLGPALASTYSDVRQNALIELSRENPKLATPVMMKGLDSTDESYRAQVWNEILPNVQALRMQPFASSAEALNWWDLNERRYDENMVVLDPGTIPASN